MSQFQMQMPGASASRKSGPNIYTGLLLLGVVCLGAAVAITFQAAMKVAPESGAGGVIKIQTPGQIKLPN